MRDFDEKLANLRYQANSSGKPKRNHHSKQVTTGDAAAKPKGKWLPGALFERRPLRE